jgi:hypothetical protein
MATVFDKLQAEIYESSMTEAEKESCLQKILQGREQPLGILLVGPTGSGKSSTINALFGESVATVGTGFDPQTQSITEYNLENLTLWDCPGPGDNPERDKMNEREMAAKLEETDEDGELIVDLVLVVLDASQRDMSATYRLLENLVLPILGEEAERRVLIGINKIDLLRNGRGWDYEESKPKEELYDYIEVKKDSVFRRLFEATGKKIMVVDYSAGLSEEDGNQHTAYNMAALLYQILRLLPDTKRAPLLEHLNADEDVWESNSRHTSFGSMIGRVIGALVRSPFTMLKNMWEMSEIGVDEGDGPILHTLGRLICAPFGIVAGGLDIYDEIWDALNDFGRLRSHHSGSLRRLKSEDREDE